ncbi:TetR/AcrR family transcriptional regulator [Stackebrandtia albiflava]
MTLAAVAKLATVATPSLYKHVAGLPELRTLVGVRVMDELTERVTAAVLGHGGVAGLERFMRAYRSYVADHPRRYAAMPQRPSDDPRWAAASDRLVGVLFAQLDGCGLTGSAAVDRARAIRAAVHGFATLEAAGGFQLAEDVDASYRHLTELLTAGLR